MRKYDQKGGIALVLSDILMAIALAAAIGFGAWAFKERQHYKNDSDTIVKQAVAKAEATQKANLEKVFAQRVKSPYKVFRGPATYGTITFSYPRTWSGYVDQSGSSQPINGYFYPGVVPSISQGGDSAVAFALRAELLDTDYNDAVQQLEGQITEGAVKAAAFVPPKMKKTANVQTGLRLDGVISQDATGSMVIIKVRDKTLQISTQSSKFLDDFNSVVLASLTFVP